MTVSVVFQRMKRNKDKSYFIHRQYQVMNQSIVIKLQWLHIILSHKIIHHKNSLLLIISINSFWNVLVNKRMIIHTKVQWCKSIQLVLNLQNSSFTVFFNKQPILFLSNFCCLLCVTCTERYGRTLSYKMSVRRNGPLEKKEE